MRNPLALPGALPFVAGSFEFTTTESGLSSRPPAFEKRTGDHPTHPLAELYDSARNAFDNYASTRCIRFQRVQGIILGQLGA